MAHVCYAREGNVIYRFAERPVRDAWVAENPKERRAAVSKEIPLRLRTGRTVEGLELRDGRTGAPEPLVIRRRRSPTRKT